MALAFAHGADAAMVDGSYHPNDAMTIKKVSDGTHAGEGTETFVNEKNGYKVGDNTPDDGVVASGDTVAYKWVLSVEAGRARTLEVRFDDMGGGGALRLEDFGRMAVSGSAVSGEFDASEKVAGLCLRGSGSARSRGALCAWPCACSARTAKRRQAVAVRSLRHARDESDEVPALLHPRGACQKARKRSRPSRWNPLKMGGLTGRDGEAMRQRSRITRGLYRYVQLDIYKRNQGN